MYSLSREQIEKQEKQIAQLKLLTEMLFEAHQRSKNNYYMAGSREQGTIKNLACEIRKICSELRR